MTAVAEESDGLELAQAIRAIRRELKLAMADGEQEELRLRLGPIELELGVQVSGAEKYKGAIKVWVVSIGSEHTFTDVQTHRLKLTLHPQGADGQDMAIHGQQDSTPVG